MPLDRILIGSRIRKIREELFEDSREKFARKCNLTERHIGQIERGEFLISLNTLDKISTTTGIDTDFILYGKNEKNKLHVAKNLHNIIDRSDKDELQLYYKCISSINIYLNNKNTK